jgi:hypothetical protein
MCAVRKSQATTSANRKTNVWSTEPVMARPIVWATKNVVHCPRSAVLAAFVRLNASEMAALRPLAQPTQNAATDWCAAQALAATPAAIAAGAAGYVPLMRIAQAERNVAMCALATNSVSTDVFSLTGIRWCSLTSLRKSSSHPAVMPFF